MLTLQFWRIIRAPLKSYPLSKRLDLIPTEATDRWLFATLELALPVALGILFFVQPVALVIGLFVVTMVYGLLAGTFYGIYVTTTVAGAIARERGAYTYELLCVLPGGAAMVNWMIYLARLNAYFRPRDGLIVVRLLARMVIPIMFVVTISALLLSRSEFHDDVVIMAAVSASLVAALLFDFIQSTAISGLIGMLVGNGYQARDDARTWALVLFLLAQVGVYTLIVAFGVLILPVLFATAGETLGAALAPIILVTVFFLLREALMNVLFLLLVLRLNTTRLELREVLQHVIILPE